MFDNYFSLYITLYNKRYTAIEVLFEEITGNENHHFWGACKDIATEKLKYTRWKWLSHRIDDFALEATRYMISRLVIWMEKAKLGIGALAKHIDSLERTLEWLFERWISTLKNLFDPRYSYSIPKNYIINYEEW